MSKTFTVFTKDGESDSLVEPVKIAFTLERCASSTADIACPVAQMVMIFQPNVEQSQVFRWPKDMKLAFSLFERKGQHSISMVGKLRPITPTQAATLLPSYKGPFWAPGLFRDPSSQKSRSVWAINSSSRARPITLGYIGSTNELKPLACYNVPSLQMLRAPSDFALQVYDISGPDDSTSTIEGNGALADVKAGETPLLSPTDMKCPIFSEPISGETLPDASTWKLCRSNNGVLSLINQAALPEPKGPEHDISSHCEPRSPSEPRGGLPEGEANEELREPGPRLGRPPPYHAASLDSSDRSKGEPDVTDRGADQQDTSTSRRSPISQFPIWRSESAPPELSGLQEGLGMLWEPGNPSEPMSMPIPMVSRARSSVAAASLRHLHTPTTRAPILDSEPKMITIYTSRAEESTTLKVPVQIVLTVTPKDQSKLFVSQTPIAWQVLDFDARKDLDFTVTWQPGIGFCRVRVDAERVVSTHAGAHVPLGSWVGLEKNPAAQYQWSKSKPLTSLLGKFVAARNVTRVPQTFALCSVEGIAPDEDWKFEPFVHLAPTRPNTNVEVGPPIMLQAYAVCGYKKNQLLIREDHEKGRLLTSNEEDPDPINIQTLEERSTFHLYSNRSGGVTLKYENCAVE